MDQPYNLHQELDLLDPERIRLSFDDFEDLTLERDGDRQPVTVVRAFPLTAEGEFIVLRDAKGNELGAVRNASDLEPESRRALTAALERAYFTPKILRVNVITEEFHIPTWEVETDRGPRTFDIRSSRRDIRILSAGRILIRDADGNRYEIPDYRRLDPASRALVEGLI